MRKIYNYFRAIALIFALLASTRTIAVTAIPAPVQYYQPDGTVLTLHLKGDEYIHWAETTDGYTILSGRSGGYEFASLNAEGDLVLSGVMAHNPENRLASELIFIRNLQPKLFFSANQVAQMKSYHSSGNNTKAPLIGGFPTTGTRKLLVILANFSDRSTTYTQSNFDNLMNQAGYNGTGSFKDFYYEVSYGQLTVNSTVTTWVTLPNTHDYYGANNGSGNDLHPAECVLNAVQAADPLVNFADFDNDGDGNVDGIAIFHQGTGEETGANAADIWSHNWNLSSAGYGVAQRTFDGVKVDVYTIQAEMANATDMTKIGVMCHEFGHNLGAPDFYDTDYATGGQYDGTGSWDLQAGGSWNGGGATPAHPNAYTKAYIYNWTAPILVTGQKSSTLRPANAYTDVFRYNTTTANEYFLCENRQQQGFDAAIPGHGMVIYHVDGNYISSHSGSVNAGAHQGMYPMSAVATNATGIHLSTDNLINVPGCPWPGTSVKTSFSDATTPNSKSWATANTNLPITSVNENNTAHEVTVCWVACASATDPQSFAAAASSNSQINLSWVLNSLGSNIVVAANTSSSFGTPASGSSYMVGDQLSGGGTIIYVGNALAYAHAALAANTLYYYKAWSVLSGNTYSPGVSTFAKTMCGTVTSFPFVEDFENNGATPNCWTQQNVTGTFNWTFRAGSATNVPSSAHSGAYNANFYEGDYGTNNVTKLISPELNLSLLASPTLKFWHMQEIWTPDQDELRIYYKTSAGGSWTLLASYLTSINTWTQETLSLPNPSATYYLAFEGTEKYGYGIVLDDVSVTGNTPQWTGASTTDWNTASNWSNNFVPSSGSSIVIPAPVANMPTISSSGLICSNLTINSGATLTISPTGALTVTGTLTNNNGNSGLVIKSTASGTGSLIHNTSNVAGSIERYITGSSVLTDKKYHLVSVPLVPATNSQSSLFFGSYLFNFDEASNAWVAMGPSSNTPLDETRGYMIYYPGTSTTYQFAGLLNCGSFSSLVTKSGMGYNLVPNPYPSPIDWDASSGWDKTNVGAAIYVWPGSAANASTVNYASYVTGTGGTNGGSRYIPEGQSFFVVANAASPLLRMNNNVRVHNSQAFYQPQLTTNNTLSLQLYASNVQSSDEILLHFNALSTVGYDVDYDAIKFPGGEMAPQLNMLASDGTKLAISSLPEADNYNITLELSHFENSSCTFNATGVETFANYELWLDDSFTNKSINLGLQPQYTFEYHSSDLIDRFHLRLQSKSITGLGEKAINRIYRSGSRIVVDVPGFTGTHVSVNVYNTAGQQVWSGQNTGSKTFVIPLPASAGIYLLTATDSQHSLSEKIVVE